MVCHAVEMKSYTKRCHTSPLGARGTRLRLVHVRYTVLVPQTSAAVPGTVRPGAPDLVPPPGRCIYSSRLAVGTGGQRGGPVTSDGPARQGRRRRSGVAGPTAGDDPRAGHQARPVASSGNRARQLESGHFESGHQRIPHPAHGRSPGAAEVPPLFASWSCL